MSKFIYSADWHIRFSKPRIRTDNYAETEFNKIKWICDFANDHDAAIIVAGDIFDRPVCTLGWLYRYIKLFNDVLEGIYTVYGQHDLHFHNPSLAKTPYGVLLECGAITAASEIMDVCNFGEFIPECNSSHLVAHIPVTRYAPPFFMEDAISANDFLEQNAQWDYIVTGDFHEQHVTEVDGRILFNPGPIMRADKSKIDFKPKIILHDTDTGEWEWIDIPIEPDVFDLARLDADDKSTYKKKMKEYAENIDHSEVKRNFVENLRIVMDKVSPEKTVVDIINKALEKVNE